MSAPGKTSGHSVKIGSGWQLCFNMRFSNITLEKKGEEQDVKRKGKDRMGRERGIV